MRWPSGPNANKTRPHFWVYFCTSNQILILNNIWRYTSFKLDKKDYLALFRKNKKEDNTT